MRRNKDEVLDYIIDYKRRHDGNWPGLRRIGRAIGVLRPVQPSVVRYRIERLIEEGKLRRNADGDIEVVGGVWDYERHI